MQKLEKYIEEMREMGERLMPHSFPQSPGEVEGDLSLMKTREAIVDGYEIILYFSMAEYSGHYLETFQVFGQRMPFLPFAFVSKLAKSFLGDKYLNFVDIYINNKKLYIWTLAKDKNGSPRFGADSTAESDEFEGLQFHRLNPKQVNFL